MKENKENIQYFSTRDDGTILKIAICAAIFHMVVVAICVAIHYVDFQQEPEKIPVFEMVQVKPPTPQPPPPPKTQPPPPPKPVEPPKPKVNEELPPEIKPEPENPPEPVTEPEPEPAPESEPEQPAEPVDDFAVDDMDLPTAVEAPSLNPVGSVDMDPLMQVYLERLKQIIMGNFNPPGGLNVARDAKTTVQFTVDRFGGISAIILKRSSGNKTWDHLSVRAVQISKAPELPPNYRAPNLVLHFNFTPN